MNKAFINIFLINLLIIIELVPAVMLVNFLMSHGLSMPVWFIIGMIGLVAISYLMYKNNKRD